MSFALTLSEIEMEERRKILKRFTAQAKTTQYEPNPPKHRCFLASQKEDELLLPLGAWKDYLDPQNGFPNGEVEDFPHMNKNVKFTKTLLTEATDPKGRDQDVAMKQALKRLNSEGSVFIACFTGYGKCLAPGTKVLMYDGTKKIVEDIKMGDLIMGDNSKPRTILSLCSGIEEMYEIKTTMGETFTVNKSHILTLKAANQGVIRYNKNRNEFIVYWFDGVDCKYESFSSEEDAIECSYMISNNIFDIELGKFLTLSEESKHILRLFWVPVEYPSQEVPQNPKDFGTLLFESSNQYIPLVYKRNSRKNRILLLSGIINSTNYKYRNNCYYITLPKNKTLVYDVQDICRSLGFECFINEREITIYGDCNCEIQVDLERKKYRLKKNNLTTEFKVNFKGKGVYHGFEIDGNKRFLLGNYIVTHNTACGVYLSVKLRLKTMVICHFDIVRKQWPGEYEKFTGNTAKIQLIKGKNCKLDPKADVYIIGIQKAASMKASDFINIGTVIIDEAHISTITAFTKTLLRFQPRYLIGLSATPDRPDGMHSLLTNYFGKPKDFIVREEVKDFTVYKLQTPFKPEISYTIVRGRTVPNWSAIINSIESNEERWSLIANLTFQNPSEKIIILCNRNSLANGVYNILVEAGESCALLIGTVKQYDKNKRILVAGFKKGGVGLNDPDLTMAIIASDTKDVRQYEGRIRTSNNIIYHLVDYYKPFQNHWEECETWYLAKGADIKVIGTNHVYKTKSSSSGKRFLK